ncbi:MAG: 16S rRNA (uracil(1498)-N(3))-methyltransferase [Selenomonadaceae bacterium]|nr:16S rRNA (uracil(1498)-N(3))-methyltransferase [Selenomonadaceae bacterium]
MRQIKIKMITPTIEIDGDAARHLIYSQRARVGEQLTVLDETGQRALFELDTFSKLKVIARFIEYLPAKSPEVVTLAVAIPKRGLDGVVRQATEIGVKKIQPLITERTIIKPADSKVERWRRIAKEAAEQSGAFEPIIIEPLSLAAALEHGVGSQIILCDEREKSKRLIDVVSNNLNKDILLIVGSEGGFSKAEYEALDKCGAVNVTLADNILRVDTAAIMALSICKHVLLKN